MAPISWPCRPRGRPGGKPQPQYVHRALYISIHTTYTFPICVNQDSDVLDWGACHLLLRTNPHLCGSSRESPAGDTPLPTALRDLWDMQSTTGTQTNGEYDIGRPTCPAVSRSIVDGRWSPWAMTWRLKRGLLQLQSQVPGVTKFLPAVASTGCEVLAYALEHILYFTRWYGASHKVCHLFKLTRLAPL